MYLADTLSRAYLPEVNAYEEALEVAQVDHTSTLAVSTGQLQQLWQASAEEPVLDSLRQTIQRGWPQVRTDTPEPLTPYYDFRDELTVEVSLVFKGPIVLIPAALRKDMMAACHESHIGVEGCIRRARESMFWPRMSTELKAYISKCDTCVAHRAAQPKEHLQQHTFIYGPKVGADLCEMHGRTLLVVCDDYSNYTEVESLNTTTSKAVVKALMALFARYGVPDTLVTDNGPQFSAREFGAFVKRWGVEHNLLTTLPPIEAENFSLHNAVPQASQSTGHCWIGGTLPVREWA